MTTDTTSRNTRFSSRPPSVFSAASIDTLVADQSYRGYPSKDAYLQAMREWVDSKKYYENDIQLQGFYGTKTSEVYKSRPGLRSTRPKRQTATQLGSVDEAEGTAVAVDHQVKTSALKKIFTRRKTES